MLKNVLDVNLGWVFICFHVKFLVGLLLRPMHKYQTVLLYLINIVKIDQSHKVLSVVLLRYPYSKVIGDLGLNFNNRRDILRNVVDDGFSNQILEAVECVSDVFGCF